MSHLILPEPRNPLQARAFALLLAIEDHGQLSRPALISRNDGRDDDTRRCLLFLREQNYLYICGYTDDRHPIYKIGCEIDARRPKGGKPRAPAAPKPITIPPPDPLVAALFARPATV
jgi:hypothetical protein